jgi:hypothetical protein
VAEVDQHARIGLERNVAQDLGELACGELARSAGAADHFGQAPVVGRFHDRGFRKATHCGGLKLTRAPADAQRRFAVPTGSAMRHAWHGQSSTEDWLGSTIDGFAGSV